MPLDGRPPPPRRGGAAVNGRLLRREELTATEKQAMLGLLASPLRTESPASASRAISPRRPGRCFWRKKAGCAASRPSSSTRPSRAGERPAPSSTRETPSSTPRPGERRPPPLLDRRRPPLRAEPPERPPLVAPPHLRLPHLPLPPRLLERLLATLRRPRAAGSRTDGLPGCASRSWASPIPAERGDRPLRRSRRGCARDLADVPAGRLRGSAVAFFLERNPGWAEGRRAGVPDRDRRGEPDAGGRRMWGARGRV